MISRRKVGPAGCSRAQIAKTRRHTRVWYQRAESTFVRLSRASPHKSHCFLFAMLPTWPLSETENGDHRGETTATDASPVISNRPVWLPEWRHCRWLQRDRARCSYREQKQLRLRDSKCRRVHLARRKASATDHRTRRFFSTLIARSIPRSGYRATRTDTWRPQYRPVVGPQALRAAESKATVFHWEGERQLRCADRLAKPKTDCAAESSHFQVD